jgi:hypothetical protein
MAIKLGGGGGGTPISAVENFVDKPLTFTDENGVEWLKQGTLLVDTSNQYPDVAKKDIFYHDATKHDVSTWSPRSGDILQGIAGPTGEIVIGNYYRTDAYKYQYMWARFDASSGTEGDYGVSFPSVTTSSVYYGVNYYHCPNAPVGSNTAANTYYKNGISLKCDSSITNDQLETYTLLGNGTSSSDSRGSLGSQIATTWLRNSNTTGTTAERALFAGMPTPSVPKSHIFFDHVNNKLYALVYHTLNPSSHASNNTYSQLHEWDWSQHTNFRNNGSMSNTYNVATASTMDPLDLENIADNVCNAISGIMSDETYVYINYGRVVSGVTTYNLRRFPMNGLTDWSNGTDIMDDHVNSSQVWIDDPNVTNGLKLRNSTSYSNPTSYGGEDANGDDMFIKYSSSQGYVKGVLQEAFGSTTSASEGQALSYLRIK